MRLFAALPVPAALHCQLQLLQSGLHGASWRPAENLHITLCFYDDVPNTQVDALAEALDQVAFDPLPIHIAGLGSFGKKAPFAVWAGVDGGDALRQLAEDCRAAAKRVGIQLEHRKYTPHITLAYLSGTTSLDAAQWLGDREGYMPLTYEAQEFTLYSSHLGNGPSRYVPEASYPCTGNMGW